MSFLSFDYTHLAMKNTVYSFTQRLVVSQKPYLLSEKIKTSRSSNSSRAYYFFSEILHMFSPYQCLQNLSLLCFVLLI